MKPNHSIHQIQLVLLGIPILLLSPTAHGQNQDKDEKAAEIAETEETAEEKGNARLAKEADKRAKEAAKLAKEAAKRAEENAERAKEADEKKKPPVEPEEPTKPEGSGKPAPPAKGKDREETVPGTKERLERQPDQEPGEGRPRGERPSPPADEKKPPVDMPVVPSEPLKPGKDLPRVNEVVPGKEITPQLDPDKPVERETVKIPATEPERLAETEVTEVTREVQRDLDQRKIRIEGREEAKEVIEEILGAESRISRAETAREEQFRPRIELRRPGEERLTEVSPDQRRAATTYYQQRLRGRDVDGPPPEFFRRSARGNEGRDVRVEERVLERVEFVRPRYLNEGRRYVHYDSRAAIPAILMAAQAMNQVRFQPTREIAPIFYERHDVAANHAVPLPPDNYRSENSWVVSYPVDENSMISSEDILFVQGSTQFSDPYSYEVVGVMANAMKAMPEEDRFVIEGHASAEGSYESNMVLSQQRAEHIVRGIVRLGVSPHRLLPVGYGESEARHSAEAAETLRGQDRRVVVFRMKPEPIAKR